MGKKEEKDGCIKRWHNIKKLSIEEKQEITKNQIRALMLQAYETMKLTYFKGRTLYLNNPLGLTPEQVIAGFGDDAIEIFRLHVLLKEVINIVVPGTVPDDSDPYKK